MQTKNNKFTISDLNTKVSLYNQTIEPLLSAPIIIPDHITNEVKSLHTLIDCIRKKDVMAWLDRHDFNQSDPVSLVENSIETIGHLLDTIRRKGNIVDILDPKLDQVIAFCMEWKEWLLKILPNLKERRRTINDSTPTQLEESMLKRLLYWDVEIWLDFYIFSNTKSTIYEKKRLLNLALATVGIDEHKRERLNQALTQIELEIRRAERYNQEESSQEPSTDRAQKAFKVAISKGFMIKTNNGYEWIYNNGSKASLAYFLLMVYNPDNTKETPFKALEELFGVTRLDRAADQATTTKNPQVWRGEIEELLQSLNEKES